jgi:acyl transferase domain-containing protein
MEGSWTLHSRGTLRAETEDKPEKWDIEAALADYPVHYTQDDFYNQMSDAGYTFGPTFRLVDEFWMDNDNTRAVGKLVLLPSAEIKDFYVYPVYVDCALQMMMQTGLRFGGTRTTYVPVAMDSYRVCRKADPTETMYVYTFLTTDDVTEAVEGDIALMNDKGEIVVQIEHIKFQRASKDAIGASVVEAEMKQAVFETEWREMEATESGDADAPSTWLVFQDDAKTGAEVVSKLGDSARVVTVTQGKSYNLKKDSASLEATNYEHYTQLVDDLNLSGVTGVVHLWSLDESSADSVTAAISAVNVVRALAAARAKMVLCLVTENAYGVLPEDDVKVGQSTMWGVGRSITHEYSDATVAIVDVDARADKEALASLVLKQVNGSKVSLEQYALRGSTVSVCRLAEKNLGSSVKPGLMAEDGSYVITGGFGGLGLLVAEWMASRGAKHIVLVGRSKPNEQAQEVIAALENKGVKVYAKHGVDIAEESDVKSLLQGKYGAPIKGIFHAAGVLRDTMIKDMDTDTMRSVMGPKVQGTLYLDKHAAKLPLDYFVVFSSITAVTGNAGQANYAAANSFMDGLVASRKSKGQPATSIQWGPWAEAGMASKLDDSYWAGTIFKPFSNNMGLRCMELILSAQLEAVVVGPLVMERLLLMGTKLYQDFDTSSGATKLSKLAKRLKDVPERDRERALISWIKSVVMEVLGTDDPNMVGLKQPFMEMGMESLMSVAFRNTLSAEVGKSLSSTLTFDYPNVEAVAELLSKELPSTGASKANAGGAKKKGKKKKAKKVEANEGLALVGGACRLPGGCNSPDDMWDRLAQGKLCITEIPKDRFDIDEFYSRNRDDVGKTVSRWGGFMDTDVAKFDADFFQISPREAVYLDPQQRLLLELAWEALEHAGINPDDLYTKQVGVFIGISLGDYEKVCNQYRRCNVTGYYATGNLLCCAAGRVSYTLGLRGPAMSVDTACSPSLG